MFLKKYLSFLSLLLLVLLLPACGKKTVLDTSRLGDPSLEWTVFELADYQP